MRGRIREHRPQPWLVVRTVSCRIGGRRRRSARPRDDRLRRRRCRTTWRNRVMKQSLVRSNPVRSSIDARRPRLRRDLPPTRWSCPNRRSIDATKLGDTTPGSFERQGSKSLPNPATVAPRCGTEKKITGARGGCKSCRWGGSTVGVVPTQDEHTVACRFAGVGRHAAADDCVLGTGIRSAVKACNDISRTRPPKRSPRKRRTSRARSSGVGENPLEDQRTHLVGCRATQAHSLNMHCNLIVVAGARAFRRSRLYR